LHIFIPHIIRCTYMDIVVNAKNYSKIQFESFNSDQK